MSYTVIFSNLADKQLEKLPILNQKRIVNTIKRCRIRPHAHLKKLVASPFFRLRVGTYRVIIDIQQSKLIIHVVEVGHRKDMYKGK